MKSQSQKEVRQEIESNEYILDSISDADMQRVIQLLQNRSARDAEVGEAQDLRDRTRLLKMFPLNN